MSKFFHKFESVFLVHFGHIFPVKLCRNLEKTNDPEEWKERRLERVTYLTL